MDNEKMGTRYHIFWKHRYTTVFDFIISETDSMNYQGTLTHKIFIWHEKYKKDNCLEDLLQHRRNFTYPVFYTGIIIRRNDVIEEIDPASHLI